MTSPPANITRSRLTDETVTTYINIHCWCCQIEEQRSRSLTPLRTTRLSYICVCVTTLIRQDEHLRTPSAGHRWMSNVRRTPVHLAEAAQQRSNTTRAQTWIESVLSKTCLYLKSDVMLSTVCTARGHRGATPVSTCWVWMQHWDNTLIHSPEFQLLFNGSSSIWHFCDYIFFFLLLSD